MAELTSAVPDRLTVLLLAVAVLPTALFAELFGKPARIFYPFGRSGRSILTENSLRH